MVERPEVLRKKTRIYCEGKARIWSGQNSDNTARLPVDYDKNTGCLFIDSTSLNLVCLFVWFLNVLVSN